MATAILLLALLAPAVLAESSLLQQLQASQFTGFLRLLEHADLTPEIESAIQSGKTLTVFAPTDDALLYKTSPTLVAFLKKAENKATLREILLSHIVAEKVSPFQWDGVRATLASTPLRLSMDAQAFYAGDVAVTQYNALVTADGAVHSLPTLIIPSAIASSAQSFVEEAAEVRRVLQAPGPDSGVVAGGVDKAPPITTTEKVKPDSTPASAAPKLASVLTAAAAVAVAIAF